MPTWLVYAIWIVLSLWSVVELMGLHVLVKHPKARYSTMSSMVTCCWVLCVVFWISYRIWG